MIEAIHTITQAVKDKQMDLRVNADLFNIYEGELLPYVQNALSKQLSAESYEQIKHRLAPINLLIKLIDKLSTLYSDPPTREVKDGNDTDSAQLAWYVENYKANKVLGGANEFANLFKNTLIQPYRDSLYRPRLRTIPSSQFVVASSDSRDPLRMTELGVIMGQENGKLIIHVYTDDSFAIVDGDGKILTDRMAAIGNDGSNPIGKIPFVYDNRSSNLIMPKVETGMLALTTLFPVLISDLNFVSMFQAFSILYGINVSDKGLTFAPNAFWNFEQKDPELKPSIGTIKPDADIDALISLIQFEIVLWLNSRGVRPGAVANLNADNLVSGVSKIIDEMDTFDAVKDQQQEFTDVENDLWDLTFNYLHPYWSRDAEYENRAIFTPNATVETTFVLPAPLADRGDLIDNLKKEEDAGYTTRKRNIQRLNPRFTDKEIDALIVEIDAEKKETVIIKDDPDNGSEV